MGKEVVYCFNCGVRLLRADFEKGAAFKVGSECACTDCLPDLLALLPPKERAAFEKGQANQDIKSAPRRGTGRVPMADRPTRKITSTRIRVNPVPEEEEEEEEEGRRKPAPKKKGKLPLILGVAGGLVVVILVIVLATRKSKPPPEIEVGSVTKPPVTDAAPKAPADAPAAALQKARDYQTQNPEDYEGQVQQFMDVAMKYDKTPASEEALKEANAVKDKIARGLTPQMEKLLAQIKEPLDVEEYNKALNILDKEKDDAGAKPAWIQQIDKQIDLIRSDVKNKYEEVKKKAQEAKDKGDAADLSAQRGRLVKWGIQRLIDEFDEKFGTAAGDAATAAGTGENKPAPPAGIPRNEEGKAYLEKWMNAVSPATNRDYEAATGRVEQAGQGLNEDAWKREAAGDLSDIKAIASFYKAAMKAVGKLAPGDLVSLEVVGPSGSKETIEGVITVADAEHLEIKREGQKSEAIVDPADLTASSLARVAQGAGLNRGSDLRSAALMMLLEGEAEAAKKSLVTDVPEKYWEYAKTARERAPRADSGDLRRDREARILFWGAGKEFLKMETLASAIEKYKMLAKDYVGAAIVRKNIDLITKRSEAGKEYFLLPADIKGSGMVKLVPHPELKSCWTCQEDVTDMNVGRETYVEVEFYALPGTAYQAWVFAGACCEETFFTYLQATDMVGPNPQKTSQKIPYDPGGPVAAPFDPKVKGLKKTHAQHKGEKQPSRWEWIAVPTPKYPSGGLKKIRLMTEQKGFSVAAAFVSSVRKAPPKEEEFKEEFNRAAEELKSRPKAVAAEAGLVGHWKLDDQGARDVSGQGNAGTVKGGPKSVKGKLGNALEFDGNDDVVEIPGNAALQKLQEGSYTISAWFNPKDAPPGRDKDNKANYGIVNKAGCHEGLKYTGDRKFMVEHWLTSDDKKQFQTNHATWADTHEPGAWYHVVAVVDAGSRTITIYVNGKTRGPSKPWDANAKSRDFGTTPWRIGCANPGAKEYSWPAKGMIDDVRLYNRALSAQEVQVLFGSGMAGME
jgi:hypothetical protein